MPASYPTSVKSFTTKVDGVDDIIAAHVNDLQNEVNAVETQLLSGWTDFWATAAPVGWSSVTFHRTFYRVIGKFVFIVLTLTGTSDATNATVVLPFPVKLSPDAAPSVIARARDNGVWGAGLGYGTAGSDVFNMFKSPDDTVAWTAAGTKTWAMQFFYEKE
jgi:hypothetical protein